MLPVEWVNSSRIHPHSMAAEIKAFLKRLSAQKWIELAAVVFNLLYTFFYLNSNSICFAFGIVGALLMAWLYLQLRLYAETGLQFLYVMLSVVGWIQPVGWNSAIDLHLNHFFICTMGILVVFLMGKIMQLFRRASLPYADSFMTVTAIIGSVLMILYVDTCWLYLLASNSVALMICISKRMYWATLMYSVYILMSLDGYWQTSIFY